MLLNFDWKFHGASFGFCTDFFRKIFRIRTACSPKKNVGCSAYILYPEIICLYFLSNTWNKTSSAFFLSNLEYKWLVITIVQQYSGWACFDNKTDQMTMKQCMKRNYIKYFRRACVPCQVFLGIYFENKRNNIN